MKYTLLLTVLLCAINLGCWNTNEMPPPPYNLAAMPIPRLERNSLDRRWDAYAMRQMDNAKTADVIFLGDSITDGWSNKGAIDVWNKAFADFNVANMGISSDGTQHVLYRIKLFHQKFPQAKPKCFFLMIGTNNLGYLKHTVQDSVEGTMAIVDFLLKNYPESKIIVSTLTPTRGEGSNEGCSLERITELDQAVTNELQNKSIYKSIVRFNSRDAFLDGKKSQKKGLFSDKCHLTPEGYKVWASIILPELKKQLN